MIKIQAKYMPLLIMALPIMLLAYIIDNSILSSAIAVAYWIVGFLYSVKNLKYKFTLFSFNVGFFVFILSGYVISFLINGDFRFFSNSYFSCSNDAIRHSCFAVMLCMILVNTTYIALDSSGKETQEAHSQWSRSFSSQRTVQQVLIAVIVISYICQMLGAIETLVLVRRVTYYARDNYLSALPAPLSYIASLYYISLFLYWATFPSKKSTLISIVSLGVLEFVILIAGERGEPISAILVVIFYIFLRNKHGVTDISIPKKSIIVAIILVPLVMYGLQTISYTRDNNTYEASLVQGVEDFLESQGGSVTVVARAYDLKDTITKTGGNTFVLGEIRYYLKNNVFARLITGQSVRLRNVEDALSGDNFLRTYGYVYASTSYLRGVGSGSTYIAETYHDGGYILLAIMNVLYAYLILRIDKSKGNSVISTAIILNIFRYIPLLPRGMALDWLTNTFAIQNIIILIILFLITRKQRLGYDEASYQR